MLSKWKRERRGEVEGKWVRGRGKERERERAKESEGEQKREGERRRRRENDTSTFNELPKTLWTKLKLTKSFNFSTGCPSGIDH